jgi:hypothetical protein
MNESTSWADFSLREISFQLLPQNSQRLPHLVFHRFYGNFQLRCNLLVAHFFEPAQLEHRAAAGRQPVNDTMNLGLQFRLQQLIFPIGLGWHGGGVGQFLWLLVLFGPKIGKCLVYSHSVQVGARRGVNLDEVALFPKADEHLLRKVFRHAPFADDALHRTAHRLVVCIKEFFEHRLVVVAESGSQVQSNEEVVGEKRGCLSPEIGSNDREYSAKGNQPPPINGVNGTLKDHSPNVNHTIRAGVGFRMNEFFPKPPPLEIVSNPL